MTNNFNQNDPNNKKNSDETDVPIYKMGIFWMLILFIFLSTAAIFIIVNTSADDINKKRTLNTDDIVTITPSSPTIDVPSVTTQEPGFTADSETESETTEATEEQITEKVNPDDDLDDNLDDDDIYVSDNEDDYDYYTGEANFEDENATEEELACYKAATKALYNHYYCEINLYALLKLNYGFSDDEIEYAFKQLYAGGFTWGQEALRALRDMYVKGMGVTDEDRWDSLRNEGFMEEDLEYAFSHIRKKD